MSTEIERLLDELAALDARAVTLIRSAPNPQGMFDAVDPWASALREAADRAAAMRVRIVGDIWRTESLALSVLATRISRSKARAGQLVKAAEKQEVSRET